MFFRVCVVFFYPILTGGGGSCFVCECFHLLAPWVYVRAIKSTVHMCALRSRVLYWYKDHKQKTVGKSIEMSKVVEIVNPSERWPKKGMKGFDLKQANGRCDVMGSNCVG